MSTGLTRVTEAIHGQKIRHTSDISDRIKQIYRKALITCGHKNFNPEDVKIQAQILEKSLRDSFGGVTLEELEISAERGAIGEYGEFHGINPATFIFWLRGYMVSFERKEALNRKRMTSKDLNQPKNFTLEQKREAWESAKAEYQQKGELLGELILFKYGVEIGEIDLEDEMFLEEVKYEAQKWFENERERLKIMKGIAGKMAIRKIQEVSNMDDEGRKESDLWQARCKRIAVEITFKN